MGKQFVVAIVRANGTRWNVSLSNQQEAETFVAIAGALNHCKAVGERTPVQAIVYRRGSDSIEAAWFYELGSERKLDVLTLTDTRKRGDW